MFCAVNPGTTGVVGLLGGGAIVGNEGFDCQGLLILKAELADWGGGEKCPVAGVGCKMDDMFEVGGPV